jgi:S1-C subfamily serine protease
MSTISRFARTPFGSAIAGGLVVALFGWIAIAAGWIEADDDGSSLAPTPLAETVADENGGRGLSVGQIYGQASPGVAFVAAERGARAPSPFGPFGGGGGTATGSGFVIDGNGHLLTNAHVVAGADRVDVTLGEDSEPLEAKVLGTDLPTDLAVLEVQAPDGQLRPVPLGESGDVDVGDPVVAIGNPFGLDRTVTAGIVSALQREIQAPGGFTIRDVIQTDAPINPGNSGGPLIDASGRVIGINSQIESPSGGNVGIGFAVPIDTARDVASQLIESGDVEHAFLGITGTDVTSEIADVLNLPVEEGAFVQEVEAGSPAADAGIRGGDSLVTIDGQELRAGGDVIVEVDGEPVDSMSDVIAAIQSKDPGDEIELTLARGDERPTVTITLDDRPERAGG